MNFKLFFCFCRRLSIDKNMLLFFGLKSVKLNIELSASIYLCAWNEKSPIWNLHMAHIVSILEHELGPFSIQALDTHICELRHRYPSIYLYRLFFLVVSATAAVAAVVFIIVLFAGSLSIILFECDFWTCVLWFFRLEI